MAKMDVKKEECKAAEDREGQIKITPEISGGVILRPLTSVLLSPPPIFAGDFISHRADMRSIHLNQVDETAETQFPLLKGISIVDTPINIGFFSYFPVSLSFIYGP